ncbi:hypothetical protein niasHT_027522 [Heterodera trifolii]|uniref:Uncharacterized protein n=1 Tax=Heterodera trifolii TaxID=157864 RepID=A0ABD2K534_9BILA
MSFGLGRAESVTRLSEFEPRPNPSLVRCSSLIDVNRFSRDFDRFSPRSSRLSQNDSSALWSSRMYRPSFVMDNHWFDKYYYFSPIFKGTQPYKCHVASHRLTYPSSWHQPYDYWRRVQHFWYDSDNDYAPLHRRMFEPFYGESAYTQRFWHRYRSHLLNNDVYE